MVIMVSKETLGIRRERLKWIADAIRENPFIGSKDLIFSVMAKFECSNRKAKEDVEFIQWDLKNAN